MHPRHISALLPSGFKITVCALASLVLLSIYNWGIILERFIQPFFGNSETPEYTAHYQFTRVIDNSISKNLTLGLVWSLVGVGVYTIIWGIINVYISARNSYVINTEFSNNQSTIYDRIELQLARSSLLLGSVGLLYVSFKYLLPWAFHQSSDALLNTSNFVAVASAVIGFAAMVIILHLLSVLVSAIFSHSE